MLCGITQAADAAANRAATTVFFTERIQTPAHCLEGVPWPAQSAHRRFERSLRRDFGPFELHDPGPFLRNPNVFREPHKTTDKCRTLQDRELNRISVLILRAGFSCRLAESGRRGQDESECPAGWLPLRGGSRQPTSAATNYRRAPNGRPTERQRHRAFDTATSVHSRSDAPRAELA